MSTLKASIICVSVTTFQIELKICQILPIFLRLIIKITAFINGIFSIIFEALYFLKLGLSLGLNLEAEIQILIAINLLLAIG